MLSSERTEDQMETSYHICSSGRGLTLVRMGNPSPPPLHTEAPSSPVGLPPGLQLLPALLLERGVAVLPGDLRCGRRGAGEEGRETPLTPGLSYSPPHLIYPLPGPLPSGGWLLPR